MSAITESANGKACEIRIPGYPHNPETTVHCHLRMLSGISIKPNDLLGARGCSDCHRLVDYRDLTAEERAMDRDWIRDRFHEGVVRTIAKLIKEGLVA